MIINRYLLHEIIKPMVGSLGVLSILFTSYGAAEFLLNAVNGLLPTDMIVQLISLRTLIAPTGYMLSGGRINTQP